MAGMDLVSVVKRKKNKEYPSEDKKKILKKVVLIDYGCKSNIVNSLCRRGCEVTVVPPDTSATAILALKPDGIMLRAGKKKYHRIILQA